MTEYLQFQLVIRVKELLKIMLLVGNMDVNFHIHLIMLIH